MKQRRKPGEECGNCVCWTKQPQQPTGQDIFNPVGDCLCGPPGATTLPTVQGLKGMTSWPSAMLKNGWCHQYERDPDASATVSPLLAPAAGKAS
ncbi:MAG: hypothetical protein KGL39_06920 [Patescibacteria group bacterium]|nr:hypothetical protein [Patescibacteria group bacterium]